MPFYGLAVRNVTSTHIGKLQHLADRRRIFRSAVTCWKGFAEPINGILPDGFLYVEVVLRHADIGVSHDTLDGSQVHTQRLHLADIGMPAAVRRQEGYFGNGLQSFFELVTEMSGIARAVFLSYFPDKLLIRVPQGNCAVAQAFRYRDVPVTVAGLGNTDGGCSFLHVDGLFDMDDRAIRFDVARLQCKQLLRTHSGSKHQPDAETDAVFRQFFHEDRYLLRGKGVLPFDGLANFLDYYHLDPRAIYKFSSFSRICARADVIEDFEEPLEETMTKAFACFSVIDSRRWISFLLNILPRLDDVDFEAMSDIEKRMLQMFYITIWGKAVEDWESEEVLDNLYALSDSATLLGELISLLQYRFEQIDFIDEPVNLGFDCPLDLHCAYTRDQLLVAMDFIKPGTVREGVKWLPEKQLDVFFVTLNKADKDYSPTTMYNDYSINESLFHWQSQSTTADNSPTGQRYIHHMERGSRVLLFVREFKSDRVTGGAEAYTYLGTANYVKHQGSRPMNITWRLDRPIPAKFLRKTNKLVVG